MKLYLPFVLLSLLAPQTAAAHHGFATHYDVDNQIRIEGTVHAVDLRNPHSYIGVAVVGESGEEIIWTCETQAKALLFRKGIRSDTIIIGEPITIEGSPARNTPNECEIGTAYLANDETVTLRSSTGRANIGVNSAPTTESATATSIFGLWILDSFGGPPASPDALDKLTEAGRAANATYNPAYDDPSNNCVAANPVRAWSAPGTPSQIRVDGAHIIIHHEFMDAVRKIPVAQVCAMGLCLSTQAAPEQATTVRMGQSVGRIENGALIVETSFSEDGVFLTHFADSGILHSASMKLVERFSFVADTKSLEYSWEASDAEFFPNPINSQILLAATSLKVGRYDCVQGTATEHR